ALAQMANAVRGANALEANPVRPKRLGYYFGTYNPEWFDLTPKGRGQWWMSRETAYTAVAGGADELLAGLNVPIDWRHWEDLGDALRTLQKAGPEVRDAFRGHAQATMLVPRSQCVND